MKYALWTLVSLMIAIEIAGGIVWWMRYAGSPAGIVLVTLAKWLPLPTGLLLLATTHLNKWES